MNDNNEGGTTETIPMTDEQSERLGKRLQEQIREQEKKGRQAGRNWAIEHASYVQLVRLTGLLSSKGMFEGSGESHAEFVYDFGFKVFLLGDESTELLAPCLKWEEYDIDSDHLNAPFIHAFAMGAYQVFEESGLAWEGFESEANDSLADAEQSTRAAA